jgi:hypothetical protein
MGAAAYIGRVGGLAVALGVGTAIATGYGVASADDTPSNPPSSDTTTTSGTTETKTTTNTQTSTEPSTPEPDNGTTASGTTATTVKGETTVSAQTNTGTSAPTGTTTEPTHTAEPTTEPTETAAPEPTQTPETEEPAKPSEPEEAPKAKPTDSKKASTKDAEESSTSGQQLSTVQSVADPTAALQSADPVAVFADARTLAAASPTMMSPMMAAQVTSVDATQPTVTTAPENPLTAVTRLVSNVIGFVLNPLAGNTPTTPAQPPLIWSLLAFARKEFDNFFAALAGGATDTASPVARLTSLALAAINPIPPRPAFPTPGQQLSTSTNFVDWVTGNFLPNNTSQRFSIWGTDVGTMWDNGIPDDPSTPYNEHQVLIAVGDTFSGANMTGDWRSNTILRSADAFLVDGMSIPNGEWFNGNMFGGAPLSSPTTARQVIFPGNLPAGVTLIPTAGISLPTPGTRFGATQYMSFMSVTQWGAPGQWTTNYSAIAYSTDNGENWTVAPTSVRYNQPWSGNQNFQQSAFVRPGDGYVYAYGTPNGRQGAAYVSRVAEKDILDLSKYDYYSAGSPGGWFGWGATPAGWYRNDPSKATPVFGQDTGACGVANPGNQVSEMSVQYNKSLNKYVVLYGDQFNNIVMRTSDTPQGTWSSAKVLMAQQNGGIYAPMMHPWSPATMGTGTDLYWNLSLWSQYNVMLMRTDLTKV